MKLLITIIGIEKLLTSSHCRLYAGFDRLRDPFSIRPSLMAGKSSRAIALPLIAD